MVFLHIDTKNYNVKDKTGDTPINTLNKFITSGKIVFALIYMEGCGPCNATRPEWSKLKNVLKNYLNDNNILIVDIDNNLLGKVKNLKIQPRGFPTIRFITNKGNTSEDFEDCKMEDQYKNRSLDSFVKWIKFKLNDKNDKNDNNNNNITKKNYKRKSHNKQTGGKWSRKYKNSINCKRPKGFSQRQYCKYSRKKH